MEKLFKMLLGTLLAVSLLVGCNNNNDDNQNPPPENQNIDQDGNDMQNDDDMPPGVDQNDTINKDDEND
ncbi:hypothetical protein M3589_23505, partial [Heyndrickxia oleronia]|nr:hypothetical protein [Heyndrickxia oleronia]